VTLPNDIMTAINDMGVAVGDGTPMAGYNEDGDCLEFHLTTESYYGCRLDGWVTVYIGEDTGELVGGMIKGVRRSLLRRYPGIRIDLDGGKLTVGVLLRAAAYSEASDDDKCRTYRDIIEKTRDLETDINLDACL